MKRIIKQIKYPVFTLFLLAVLFPGCTDLEEIVYREVVTENYYENGDAVIAAYLSVYGPLQDVWEENYFNIVEFSTDESCRPTRLQNGWDGGQWIRYHRHEWLTIESRIEDVWNKCYKGIGFANTYLADFPKLDFARLRVDVTREQMTAELRGMRAFYYYLLCDLFGGVP
ncbi:MAG: RagB/SusD family nutrient uptake outer membrane protein, partial [Dysgonamonadaceae bacterium]|nr:RagB/SusD family nutrient uptake outer membrane protein [Dysgonamonadaceae bacterium]